MLFSVWNGKELSDRQRTQSTGLRQHLICIRSSFACWVRLCYWLNFVSGVSPSSSFFSRRIVICSEMAMPFVRPILVGWLLSVQRIGWLASDGKGGNDAIENKRTLFPNHPTYSQYVIIMEAWWSCQLIGVVVVPFAAGFPSPIWQPLRPSY